MLEYYKGKMCPGGVYSKEKTLNVVQWPGEKKWARKSRRMKSQRI